MGNYPPAGVSLELLCLEQEEIIEKQAAQIHRLLNERCLLLAADEEVQAPLTGRKDRS